MIKIKLKTIPALTLLITTLVLSFKANISHADTDVTLKPYILLGVIEGDLSTEGVESDFNVGWDEIGKLNGAVGVDLDIRKEDFNILTQASFTILEDTEPTVQNQTYKDARQDFESIFVTETLGINLYNEEGDTFDLNFGGRFANVSNTLTLREGAGEREYSESDSWVDPVVGFYTSLQLGDACVFHLGGDYGGFDVGSKQTWQALTALDFALTQKAAFSVGYRALDHEYDKDGFKYDILMHGPTMGFQLNF